MSGVISYPIPAFSNVSIQEITQPGVFVINDLTLGFTTLVETTTDHNYVVGQQVRLIIPQINGTYQLNNATGFVLSIPADNQVVLDIFSLGLSDFVSGSSNVPPQIIAIGDINSGAINSSTTAIATTIPGAFQVTN